MRCVFVCIGRTRKTLIFRGHETAAVTLLLQQQLYGGTRSSKLFRAEPAFVCDKLPLGGLTTLHTIVGVGT